MKVVIIDDEPLISDKLKRIMETGLRGMHTVCAFTDAQMALDYIEQEKPGVILTDIRMPGITGIDLAKQINQMDYGAKIVFLTGYAEFEYAREAIRLGAFDYLLKPIIQDKLYEVLDNAGDTIKHTTIPTQKEILNDLNSQEDVDECWGVTDNYGMKIFLEYGIHFI